MNSASARQSIECCRRARLNRSPLRSARRAWLAALLLAPVLAAHAPATHEDTLDNIAKAGVLKVAVPEDYPPFGSAGADMMPQGYDIDTTALLANAMNIKLELVPVNNADRIPYLQAGKVDLVFSSLGNALAQSALERSRTF